VVFRILPHELRVKARAEGPCGALQRDSDPGARKTDYLFFFLNWTPSIPSKSES
jgi:hypothetical protein